METGKRYAVVVGVAAAAAGALAWWTFGSVQLGAKPRLGPTRFATPAAGMPSNHEQLVPPIPADLALKQVWTLNQSAFIPPQCYVKTTDEQGRVHNPCMTCHVASREPNSINDADVQLEYAFVPRARQNAWKNLFVDWTARIATISDAEISSYVRRSNYFDEQGQLTLAKRLQPPPEAWDHRSDGVWSGFIPDVQFRIDDRGFDQDARGGYTGWRAFGYYPVPGAFWPANGGSFGDVLIRLPEAFRQDATGRFDRSIYDANLGVIEALVTRKDVAIEGVDEAVAGFDVDADGKLGRANRVAFISAQNGKPGMSYLGRARSLAQQGQLHLGEGLYPEGTEFVHTLRYLDVTPTGVRMAARMKEMRYAKKTEWFSEPQLQKRSRVEAISKEDSPTELRNYGGDIERGVSNNQGWFLQAFIEDATGALRPQTFEENVACIGCHGGVGATDDSIFSFSRRFGTDTFQDGWYHWTQSGFEGIPDRPVHGGSSTEYVTYLEQNGAGDEFRQNNEILSRFFDAQGQLLPNMRKKLSGDISQVLIPSAERALALNKAYRLLVQEQTFRLGRDLVLGGAKHVYSNVEPGQKTGVTRPVEPGWSATLLAAGE